MNRQLMQNNRGKGRLKYLLQQTELFAHFAKGDQSSSQKKSRGRYVPKIFLNYPMATCPLFFLCSCSEFYCIWHLDDIISYTFKVFSFCFHGRKESGFHCKISHNGITIPLFSMLLLHHKIMILLCNRFCCAFFLEITILLY